MSTLAIITPQHYLVLLVALIFLGSPSFILLAAAANQCFGADDGEIFVGILNQAVNDYIFQDCPANNNCAVGQTYGWPMNSWCVGNVTDMSYLLGYIKDFNEDISGWNTSSVTEMESMFEGLTSFNGDLSAWNTKSVTNMRRMFYGAVSFNGDISGWNTSDVTSMGWMFNGATSFNQDLCAWGDKFPYNNADVIFADSGCTYQDGPQEDQKGPFCASDCNGAAITPKPASGAVYYFTAAISSFVILLGFYQ
mmetsp:Transcript_38359/g.92510  ORF Transcript_38359/g.92510 Transcript_38359/m.92510 type:complete len:251 (+) Transcript_38359:156-908(+)|eukprot:CAMPEP_0181115022 /NCGR_PEP_ID=MMETSP1071-20121207/21212_1 /TAXON_ID=35127 /ORGANISM="Thalassiosira sp., Strain NH16" /LENGTH=250 /DNA_ID=CAMNT_0023199205 /DNA_START=78 /DNA_END=830 /DNA_ORIENTATION=+